MTMSGCDEHWRLVHIDLTHALLKWKPYTRLGGVGGGGVGAPVFSQTMATAQGIGDNRKLAMAGSEINLRFSVRCAMSMSRF